MSNKFLVITIDLTSLWGDNVTQTGAYADRPPYSRWNGGDRVPGQV